MGEFNISASMQAQSKYCEDNSAPHFAPKSGVCWNCRRNVYEPYHWKIENGVKKPIPQEQSTFETGITVEKAGNSLVTGCPHCNRSYCD
ncbi:hypothetical protein SAMN05216232_0214 [Virgibacillus subterraneus]|uniref:Uncharacterized protein n=1 Tax=Virgibacillus subterraneus TaxID=621109 RepID=A0A1H8YZF6_9BACI|nr:hypothetical protein SAMN05216232_0214 [Virgibacillus subterraneus]